MKRRVTRVRNVHVIVATSAGLVILVAAALGWLGWRLLSQEKAIQEQQTRSRLEQSADALLTGFLRRMTEIEAGLTQIGSALPSRESGTLQTGDGILVVFSTAGIETQPPNQLLYYPVPPSTIANVDTEIFAAAERLEFQAADFKGALAALSSLAANKDPQVRAETLLRMARIATKSGDTTGALATYAILVDEKLTSPLGAPYGLLSRFERSKLLAGSHQDAAARQEAAELWSALNSAQWRLSKESYVYYSTEARKVGGMTKETTQSSEKLAVADIVSSAWDEWQLFQHSGSRSLTKHLHRSGPSPALAILNANPERMIALVYAGEPVAHLAVDPAAQGGSAGIQASLVDEHGRLMFGATAATGDLRTLRPLSAAELPWHFSVGISNNDSVARLFPERRQLFILALVLVVLLVGVACYAMMRGVLREMAAGQLQSDFVSAVSHEFRSPLTTLRQLTELLSEGRIHDESRRRLYFDVLRKETLRLYQLVEDLLDFGRMDAGRRQYRLERIDFCELVREGVLAYRDESNGNGHTIELTSNNGSLLVHGDREALRRVVRNLVENAVKYSPNAQTVWVETGSEKRSAVLRVRDAGIGIPPDERSRIFEKFVRGEAAKQACIPGTGVGLAMVQEIVRVHHGELDLDSEVGRGSTFVVRLPLQESFS
jgi:signal transduction histidine kinase